ncbi:hypothetical protein P7C70_g7234, partial [Phenoliferia sp. Uapishka_3]
MSHHEDTPELEVGNFTPEDTAKINQLVADAQQAIADRSPPHLLFCLPFNKCLRITASLLIILDQPFNSGSFHCAVRCAEAVIHEETVQMSVARAFWLGRSDPAEDWVEAEDKSVPFTDAKYTSSNATLDACFTVRDIYPLVDNYSTNFKADGHPRRTHYKPSAADKPTGPKDKKAAIVAARDRAYDAFGVARAAEFDKWKRLQELDSQAPSTGLQSRSPSVEIMDHENGYDVDAGSEQQQFEMESDHNHGYISPNIIPSPVPTPPPVAKRVKRKQPVAFASRIAPQSLSARLGDLALSDDERPARPSSRKDQSTSAAPRVVREGAPHQPRPRKRQVAEVASSDSDSSGKSSAGGESTSAPLTSYEVILRSLHQTRMEPTKGRGALKGLALETYRMAQYTRAFDKKQFKQTIDASILPIHPRILEAIAKNEPFNFTCLNTEPNPGEQQHVAVAALPGVFTAGKPPSLPFANGLQWAKAFKLYCDARLQWYPWESEALEEFGDWFVERLGEEGNFSRFIAFFADRFHKVGTPGNPHTVDGLIHDQSAIVRHLTGPANGASGSGRGHNALTSADSSAPTPTAQQICKRFNLGDNDHNPCRRRHVCANFDSTLTDAPLPSIPQRVLDDPVINATLRARPDLFKVSTPIDIGRLRNLLTTHPNCPLVDSVLHGLEFGFWPGHDGDFSKIDHLSGPAVKLDNKTLNFLADHSAKDLEKGYLSSSFTKLLPGMHVSPDYATDPINQRPRPINDLTASGLNDGVTKAMAKVRYDAQAELGAIARYRFRKGQLADPLADPVFWKSDVSGGFRNLPVSPYWQVKQVHRTCLRVGSGHVWVYHVDQRLLLGGRMSPRIFCTVMSLVLWAARREFALEFPVAFVDDTFGLDANGVRVPISHYLTGETKLVCLEQAKVLTMWNYLRFPWSWDKQPMGKSQLIIGNVFTLITGDDGAITDMTISLAKESVELYASDVKKFLNRKDGRPKLKEWLAVQGYSSWAVGVLHWGRFALECLYEKTSGKTMQMLPLSMNNTVKQDLNWFVNELRTAPPLSLLEPALEHWGVNDTHIILHTDACLLTIDKKSSGLGFWTTIDNKRRHFFHRTPSALRDIRWAEALAVFSAINWAIDNTPSKRIMIFTDSALLVNLRSTGQERHRLAATSHFWSRKSHGRLPLSRYFRKTCAQVRRITINLYSASTPARRACAMSLFQKRARALPTPRKRAAKEKPAPVPIPSKNLPNLSFEELDNLVDRLIHHSLASGTRRGYESSMKHWEAFVEIYRVDFKPTSYSLPLFCAFLSRRIKHPDKILSAMAAFFKPSMPDWDEIRGSHAVAAVLTGASKQPQKPTKQSPPLLPHHLIAFVEAAVAPGATYDDILFALINALGFCGVMFRRRLD